MGLDIIILCGGEGKRLRPLTEEIPKPMVLINGKPIIYYIIQHLEKYNINNYIFKLNYSLFSIFFRIFIDIFNL